MEDGQEMLNKLCKEPQGIPWFAILDGDGTELVNSTGPDGNCGCPVTGPEIAHFIEMIKRTSKEPTEESLAAIQKSLEDYTAKWR